MTIASCVYDGQVVHKRLRPATHALSYRVFSLFVDVDRLDQLDADLRLFSRNRFNAVSLYDADHGARDGRTIADHARATLSDAGLAAASVRVMLLCYPRVFGYGFNPISVYYGYDATDRLAAVVYEVNNTFGERRSYVVPITSHVPDGTPHAHACTKDLYVSPFTDMEGRYGFRLSEPGATLALGVNLRDANGPVLKTHFRGAVRPLTDTTLARLLWQVPFLTLKVTGAIHYEALRLWLKGVTLTARPAAPKYAVTHVAAATPTPSPAPLRPLRAHES
jgi:DUF1365 family protein